MKTNKIYFIKLFSSILISHLRENENKKKDHIKNKKKSEKKILEINLK